ncbi:hypothetical protein LLEC1_00804 [Akanthomyces lecanii]|uniref:Uncharacterized protein n=1 Tax=Cordyceps confragosa TaxID=2714763 RepID=A0A179I8L0_CORDF|nr:hypothetical protein LLEC1_00804 [Akanthomyces lecanii]
MSPNERLYVALYARGGHPTMRQSEDKYHWAFILGPKSEGTKSQGKRFHAKETMRFIDGEAQSVWAFEERDIEMAPTAMILVRILIGKVKKRDRLKAVLRAVPIRAGDQIGWNCVYWIIEALHRLHRHQQAGDGIFEKSANILEWESIRDIALWYVAQKEMEHRFDGLAEEGAFDNSKVPTWDMLKNCERQA